MNGDDPVEAEPDDPAWLLLDVELDMPVGFLLARDSTLVRYGIADFARGQGGGSILLRVLRSYATREGWPEVSTYTAADNVASMAALVRAGYVPTGFEVEGGRGWITWTLTL